MEVSKSPYGTTYKLFSLDGIPVKKDSPYDVPMMFKNGEWVPFYDTFRFMHEADPIGQDEFDRLVAEAQGQTSQALSEAESRKDAVV